MRYTPQGYTRKACEHYMTDSRVTISCQPPEREVERTRVCFPDHASKDLWIKRYCFVRGSDCPYKRIYK